MFGFNELILPLLGGYVFLTTCYVTRYKAEQWSGYHLFFSSAIAGSFLFGTATTLLSVVKWQYPDVHEFCNHFFPKKYPYLDNAVLAFGLAFISWWLFNLGWLFINYFWLGNQQVKVWEVKAFGNPLQRLLGKAFSTTNQVALSLNSGKVYVGFVTQVIEVKDETEYLLVFPQLSGYRDSETKRFRITSNYDLVYKQIKNRPEEFGEFNLDNFQIVVPASELESVSLFDPNAFDYFPKS